MLGIPHNTSIYSERHLPCLRMDLSSPPREDCPTYSFKSRDIKYDLLPLHELGTHGISLDPVALVLRCQAVEKTRGFYLQMLGRTERLCCEAVWRAI